MVLVATVYNLLQASLFCIKLFKMASMIAAGAATQLCSAKPFTTCKPSRALRAARQPVSAATTAGCRDQVIKQRCTRAVHQF